MTMDDIHRVLSAIHLTSSSLLAILLITLGTTSYPIYESITTREGVLITYTHPRLEAAWLLVMAGTVSGINHLVAYTGKMSPMTLRWIDYSVSSGLMLVVIAVLSGIGDLWVLVNIFVLQWILMIVCGIGEAKNSRGSTARLLILVLSVAHIIGCWACVFSAISKQEPPLFVWVIVILLFVLYMSFGVVYALAEESIVSNNTREALYALLSVTAKLELQWTLYSGTESGNTWALVVASLFIVMSIVGGVWIKRVVTWLFLSYQDSPCRKV